MERTDNLFRKHQQHFFGIPQKLIQRTDINNFSCNFTPSSLIIRSNSHLTFSKYRKTSKNHYTSAEFHTFSVHPHNIRRYKVIHNHYQSTS